MGWGNLLELRKGWPPQGLNSAGRHRDWSTSFLDGSGAGIGAGLDWIRVHSCSAGSAAELKQHGLGCTGRGRGSTQVSVTGGADGLGRHRGLGCLWYLRLVMRMVEAGVDGALIVQPINHKFDHSYVTSVLKKHPTKFVGCCLANPAEDGSGIKQLEHLILKDGYRAVRFNPYLWPPGQKMTNEIGKAMFSKAGELGVPVGFMCMKGLDLHLAEIEELCTEFPKTVVMLDHVAFCKPPINDEESLAFSELLKLSRFPQVHIKFSALFRVSRKPYPYDDLFQVLSQVVSSFGVNRVMWGSDFPYVVPKCGYKEAKEAVSSIANQVPLSSSELDWIMGGTIMQLFQGLWLS
ncbi:hypothetical protein Acr_00g0031460 [Actinidia rufa]|uniref:Amidohydrolase-related domain-containing protein n=1 Tax=Actinidia rufa TaxID=165716 RepID=A0A7J0DF42_9ERIC|nr:hypothetical protein Acr_00g0031460 [Actinidia rufa]